MSEWKEYRLGDCIEAIIDNRGKSAPTNETGGFPLLEINSIGGYYPNYGVIRKYVDENTYRNWFRSGHPVSGDILIPTVGTIGIISIMDNTKACIAQNLIALRIKKDISNVFIYYFLKNPIIKRELLNLDIGGVQPSIKVPHLLNLSISLPPREVQTNIASILSSLDDKIDLLNHENATLEAMAETLFRQWFIEEAKEDWEEGKLGDICEYVKEKADIANIDRNTYVTTENMCSNKQGVVPPTSVPKNIKVTIYSPDDILLSNIRPYFKKLWLSDRNGGCSNDVLCIRSKSEVFKYLVYYTIRQDEFFNYVMLGSKGSKMPRGDKHHIMNWPIQKPPKQMLELFNEFVLRSIGKMQNNNRQILCLEKQRDTLLPKLMSNEIEL